MLTALSEERNALVEVLGLDETHGWQGSVLRWGQVGGARVLSLPIGSMGNVGAAQAATMAINVWNPETLMLVGIAGGFRDAADDLALGDVLVPDQIIGYESAKVKDSFVSRRYQSYRASWDLLQIAHEVSAGTWAEGIKASRPANSVPRAVPKVFWDPVLSGEKVVANKALIEELRADWPKAVGVEMEGLGCALPAYRQGPQFLMVKAVCDFADATKDDDWHEYSAESAARFALAVLSRAVKDSTEDRPQAQPASFANANFSGPVKLKFVRRLSTSWEELADLYDVPAHERARFRAGEEARDLWNWLEARDKLSSLPEMLRAVGRDDLAELFS